MISTLVFGSPGLFSRSQFTLETLALNHGFAETFAKEVLGVISTTMATVTANRNDQSLVLLVVSKHALKAVGKRGELVGGGDFALEQFRLHSGAGETLGQFGGSLLAVDAHGAAFALAEEVVNFSA